MSAASQNQNHRRMIKAELGGRHTYSVSGSINVHIYRRQDKFLARGRINRTAFGATLGDNDADAECALRHLLVELENGAFVRPSEARTCSLRNKAVPRLSLRELCSGFLAEKRRLRGAATMQTYQSRLGPALDFFELRESRRQWPLANDLNRDAILQLRNTLMNRQVTRNGRPGAMPKFMSPRQIRNCLETLRNVLAWASRADVRMLPPDFVIPVTADLVGPQPVKNPLRQAPIPMTERVRIVKSMDTWQLLHLSILTVLPLRFEDVAGALISDIDLERQTLRLGSRFGGSDFRRAGRTSRCPCPPI